MTLASKFLALTAVSLLPLAGVTAQVAPPSDPIAPLPEGAPVPPPEPVLPPPVWQVTDAQALLGYIGMIGAEGLDPRDYDPNGLMAALRSNDPVKLSQAATDRYLAVAGDLALGHVRGSARGSR